MGTLLKMTDMGHENVYYCYDKETGLKAIIAIHDTTLGPAIGGTRFYDYSNEKEALVDVLRLSKGMTYKNAAAGLPIGGGKAVIVGDPNHLKTPELLKAYGKFVNRLNGIYYTAEDMNIGEEDVEHILTQTPFCVGQKNISGNPSPYTARGVYQGIKACAKEVYGDEGLRGKKIAISGVGSVGFRLAKMLYEDGARLFVADTNPGAVEKAVKELDATAVSVEEIYWIDVDILAPCAMGAVFSKDNVPQIKAKIIAGAANNVLVDHEAGDAIHRQNILYAPDYIINAGGIINCALEILEGGWGREKALAAVDKIYDNVSYVIKTSKEKNLPTYAAANEYAEAILKKAKKC